MADTGQPQLRSDGDKMLAHIYDGDWAKPYLTAAVTCFKRLFLESCNAAELNRAFLASNGDGALFLAVAEKESAYSYVIDYAERRRAVMKDFLQPYLVSANSQVHQHQTNSLSHDICICFVRRSSGCT